jgi:hypothetical protein
VQYVSPALEYPSEKIGEVRHLLPLRSDTPQYADMNR